jgi:N-acetylmuramoyl-L-alanine amidase
MTSGEGPDRGLTRRAVLRGATVAGAVALVDPGAALGAPGRASVSAGGRSTVFSRLVGGLAAGSSSHAVSAPGVFSLAGVEWEGSGAARIELRARLLGGSWSPWVIASVLGHGPDRVPAGGARFGEPVWTGPADQVQLRSSVRVFGVRVHFVAPPTGGGGGAHVAQAMPLAQPILDAGPGQPPIIARGAWAQGHAPPTHVPEFGNVKLAFVHHSDGANGYGPGEVPSILLGIFDYHVYVRDFWDIAYNFAIDAFGRIWEARAGGVDEPVIGAHAGGYNQESTGVVVLGTYSSVVPSPAAIAALERLLAWKMSLHGLPTLGRVTVEVNPSDAFYTPFAPGAHVSLPRVAGHRDGDTTDCPGNAFYARLTSIRPQVARLAGTPAKLMIFAPSAPVSAGASVTVSGRLMMLGGGPLAGEPLELQSIGVHGVATTIATSTADDAGAWTFSLTPAQTTLLRVLHRPAPAVVSDVVLISVVPVLTLAVDSSSPVRVSGTVAPAGPHVTIDLYRVAGGRRHLLASKRVLAAGGTFTVGFGSRRPGRYVVIARTPLSVRFAGAASAPLAVVV